MTKLQTSTVALATALAMSSITPAFAQGADAQAGAAPAASDTGLGDIVVTARKRNETLLDVPVAVNALSAATLERAGSMDLRKIATLAPALVVSRSDSGSGATFAMRGVGSSAIDAGIEQSVSVAIDGIQITRGNFAANGFFDLERVEVLKGPQALFFGKNASAGVVSLTSAAPTKAFEGYVRAGYEFKAKDKYVEGVVSGPLTDNLQARLAIRASDNVGYMHVVAPAEANPFTPQFPLPAGPKSQNVRNLIGRVSLNYQPTDTLSMKLRVTGNQYKDNGSKTFAESYCTGGQIHGTALGVEDPLTDCEINLRTSHGNVNPAIVNNWPHTNGGKPFTNSKTALVSFETEYDGDKIDIVSTTGFFYLKFATFDNAEFTTFRLLDYTQRENTKSFSQELRLSTKFDGPVNLMFGGYADSSNRHNGWETLILYLGTDPVTGVNYNQSSTRHDKAHSFSGFGQVRWNILENLELSGGVRYTNETKKTNQFVVYNNPIAAVAFSFLPQGTRIVGTDKESNWSPEVTLTWKPTTSTMFYGAFKTGYKSGGFSDPGILSAGFTADNLQVSGERVKGFEVGTKSKLFDNSLLLQLTAYDYKFSNLQVTSFDAPTVSFFVENAAALRTKGVELEANWRVTPGLTLNGSANYNDVKYLSYPGAACYAGQPTTGPGILCIGGKQDLTGTAPPRAPKWTLTGGFDFVTEMTDALKVGLNGEVRYSGTYNPQDNNNPGAQVPSYAVFNAGVRVFTPDNRWELAVIGRNLANKLYILWGTDKVFGTANEFQGNVGEPRSVAVQGTFRF